MKNENHTILLFYKYVPIEHTDVLKDDQRKICEELGVTGRIIIAHEGINATVEGAHRAIEEYIAHLTADERFKDIVFKKSAGTGDAFLKLSIKVRQEIVSLHLGEGDVDPNEMTGKYLPAEELYKWFREGKDFHIVDMRNDYEYGIGHFKNSHLLPMRNFRDLPQKMENIEDLKDKTVVAVCTGGIRCEKATGFLRKQGFENIYQLEHGIVTYMEKYPNQDYVGKLYVFDGRVSMGFDTDSLDHVVVGLCQKCGDPSDIYRDCKELSCGPQYISCDTCYDTAQGKYCSQACLSDDQ